MWLMDAFAHQTLSYVPRIHRPGLAAHAHVRGNAAQIKVLEIMRPNQGARTDMDDVKVTSMMQIR